MGGVKTEKLHKYSVCPKSNFLLKILLGRSRAVALRLAHVNKNSIPMLFLNRVRPTRDYYNHIRRQILYGGTV
jgi:hypothetical protein